MNIKDTVPRLLKKYREGVYTRLEVLPAIVACLSKENATEVFDILPPDIRTEFIKMIHDYPLEGGIQIGTSDPLCRDVIAALKSAIAGSAG